MYELTAYMKLLQCLRESLLPSYRAVNFMLFFKGLRTILHNFVREIRGLNKRSAPRLLIFNFFFEMQQPFLNLVQYTLSNTMSPFSCIYVGTPGPSYCNSRATVRYVHAPRQTFRGEAP